MSQGLKKIEGHVTNLEFNFTDFRLEMKEFKEEMYTFRDNYYSDRNWIFKKLEKIDHEMTSFMDLYRRHDVRIERLEKKTFGA